MIATYPQSSPLDITHRETVTKFTKRFQPYSDFNFTSLFSWNTDNSIRLSWLNDNLVIIMPGYLDGHRVYSILGRKHIDESIDTLLEATDKLELVPEIVVQAIRDRSKYIITEERDNFDYIHSLAHLSALAGNRFKKHRNKINLFMKDGAHIALSVTTTKVLDQTRIEAIRKCDRQWATANSRAQGDILMERKALDKLLDNFASFDVVVTELSVDGKTKAFSINEILDHQYAICHFEKALLTHHKNISTYMVKEVATELKKYGVQWVNWEQDLGLDGLRHSKMSYRPVYMLKKYSIARSQAGDISANDHHH